jgi:hypothetical protein
VCPVCVATALSAAKYELRTGKPAYAVYMGPSATATAATPAGDASAATTAGIAAAGANASASSTAAAANITTSTTLSAGTGTSPRVTREPTLFTSELWQLANQPGVEWNPYWLPHCPEHSVAALPCLACANLVVGTARFEAVLDDAKQRTLLYDDGPAEAIIPERIPFDKGELEKIHAFISKELTHLVNKSDLSPELKQHALNQLRERTEAFCDDLHVGGAAKLGPEFDLKIELTPDAVPPRNVKSVKVGPHMIPIWRKTIEELLRLGIIKEIHGNVPWLHRAFFVNQHGNYRFVVNYKPGVNRFTVPESSTLPRFADLSDQLAAARAHLHQARPQEGLLSSSPAP